MAIRKNESLNCACCNPSECPNGSDYADRINPISGRKTCSVVNEVKPIDIKALDTEIDMSIEVRKAEKRFQTREEFLFEEEKGERSPQVSKKAGTVNDPARIAELLVMSEILKIVDLSHRKPNVTVRKDLSFLVSEEYQHAAVRQEERRMLLREKLGIVDNNPPIDYYVLPNPHRYSAPRKPLWAKKLG